MSRSKRGPAPARPRSKRPANSVPAALRKHHEVRVVKLSQLKPAPYNPRVIEPRVLDGLAASLARFGLVEPIIWNESTGHIVGGHQRYAALQKQGIQEAQVIVVDLEARDEKELNIALNNLSGDWDYTKLKNLLEELEVTVNEREMLGFTEKEFDELLRWGEQAGAAPAHLGQTPEDKKDVYENNVIRQIVLYYDAQEYLRVLAKMKTIAEIQDPQLETNSDVVNFLLHFYEAHNGIKAED